MQNEVADSVYAEQVYQIVCVDHVSFGFTHLAVALQQPRMTKYLFRKRQIECHQEDRPVNGMETDDVFSDQMQVCRPQLVELLGAVSVTVITDSSDVVGQCIQPYIGNVLRVEGYRDSPGEGGSGYTEILQSRKKEVVHHLVLSGNRLDELRMGVDIIDQSRCIFAHFEEICLFFCRGNRASAVRAFSVYKLGLGEEGFTRCTVKTFIISFVDISLIVQFFEDFLYLCLVIGVGGTDEFVVGRIHQIPDSLDLGGYVIYEFFWCDACLFCFQLDLLAMLIGSGLEEYIVALLTFEAGDAVCEYDLVGVSNVRLAGCIGNRRGDIIFRSDFFHCFHFSFQIKKLPYSALL